jgi:AcrR family transcriptional regulator
MRRKLNGHEALIGKRRPQLRALQTRKELMDAARRVFARDGFELARLEDIADAAGKTRGAFYDHFKDKEDVFFAMFEEDLFRYLQHAREQLETARTADERIEALTRHVLHVLNDRRKMLLFLEFKMYAIRHPQQTRRLAKIQQVMCQRGVEAVLEALVPEFQHRKAKTMRAQNAKFGAVLDGLTMNRMFDPPSISEKETVHFIRAMVRIILHPDSSERSSRHKNS